MTQKTKELITRCYQLVDDCGSPYPEIHTKQFALLCLLFASDYANTKEELIELSEMKIQIEKL